MQPLDYTTITFCVYIYIYIYTYYVYHTITSHYKNHTRHII